MITENNKIIAEFLNPNDKHNNFYFPQFKEPYIYQGNLNGYSEIFGIEGLKFHSDWNWLIEVIEKIESFGKGYNVMIGTRTVIINAHNKLTNELQTFDEGTDNGKLKALYNACLNFIKWYNEQKE